MKSEKREDVEVGKSVESNTPFSLRAWAGDSNTIYIQCDTCKARGAMMSRVRDHDPDKGGWLPKTAHLPPCKHFELDRLLVELEAVG